MGRAIAVVLAGALLIGATGTTAVAGPKWCEADPIVVVDGQQVRLVAAFAWANLGQVSGVTYVVTVPAGSRVRVVTPPSAFVPNEGVILQFSDNGERALSATITVHAASSFDVTVTASAASGETQTIVGTSNSTIAVSVPLGR